MILNTAILKKRLHGARIDQLADSNETAIIDDHIQSIGKVLFSQLFVCSQGVFFWGVGVWSEGWGGGVLVWVGVWSEADSLPEMATSSASRHPTGMLSCSYIFWLQPSHFAAHVAKQAKVMFSQASVQL